MIDYGKFRLSLKRLEQQYGSHWSCVPVAPVECLGPLVRKPGDHDAISRTRTSRGSLTPAIPGAAGRTATRTPQASAGARRTTRCAGAAMCSPPARYVGAPLREDDGEPFEDKMKRLVSELQKQQAEGARPDTVIAEDLKALGFRER